MKKAGAGRGGLAGSLDPIVVGMGSVGTRPDLSLCLRHMCSRQFPHVCQPDTLLTVETRVSEIPVQFTRLRADWRLM